MMDKAWAARARARWIGKHTNLITPEYGSWVFIGELLLSIDLDYETEVVADHCGSCTLAWKPARPAQLLNLTLSTQTNASLMQRLSCALSNTRRGSRES